ncbi:DUF488 domain-containing protein [Frigoribacterium sp. CFBP 8766]|uniref:DUF488 domain-containing protein n=1 Tax=Frigoribacterium sp. CFBP 8766 TaxID=2775273 RepID=UPI0017854F95|nr:DUF488 domain-containing protein [Frigoribacterium sp. CFBP 8766]MBD8583061.1 DUF488 domain-containing protein [Frigoribacterium sp. CFBP 8766]
MTTTSGALLGVGYEGLDIDAFISRLRLRGVQVVVDVRLNPLSRKRGFSKVALASALAGAGIEYRHLRALGNPKDNRAGFALEDEAGQLSRTRYSEELKSDSARAALVELSSLAEYRKVAVMCFEADESTCHRAIVLAVVEQLRQPA